MYTEQNMEDYRYYITVHSGLDRVIACHHAIIGLLIIESDDCLGKLLAIYELCDLVDSNQKAKPRSKRDVMSYCNTENKMVRVEAVAAIQQYLHTTSHSLSGKFSKIREILMNANIPKWAQVGRSVKYGSQRGIVTDISISGTIYVKMPSGMTVGTSVENFSR